MKYLVKYTYEPDDKAWIVTIPSVKGCHTWGRSLRQARGRVREALAASLVDLPPKKAVRVAESAELVEELAGPKAALEAVRHAIAARDLAREAADVADIATRKAVLAAAAVFSLRDTGDLLGLSHQRVQQLARKTKRPASKKP